MVYFTSKTFENDGCLKHHEGEFIFKRIFTIHQSCSPPFNTNFLWNHTFYLE